MMSGVKRLRGGRGERGVALILTLAVLSILAVIVVGFLVNMRTEQVLARSSTQLVVARQLAQAGIEDALFLLRNNMPPLTNGSSYICRPGAVASWPISGTQTQTALYSTSLLGVVDLNADQSIIASNELYNASGNRMINVNWVTVLTNGAPGTNFALVNIALQGRYAYWVDNESSKVNINYSKQRGDPFGYSSSNIDLTALSSVTPYLASNSLAYAQTNGFFTPEHWQSTFGFSNSIYLKNQFYITPYSSDVNLTPWGLPTFNLNTNMTSWLQEISQSGSNSLDAQGMAGWFGRTLASKYNSGGASNAMQILANMVDFIQGTNATSVGAQNLAGGGAGTSLIPNLYCGLRKYPHLNEIGCRANFWYPGSGNDFEVDLWLYFELINPYDTDMGAGSQIKIDMDKLWFHVTDSADLVTGGMGAGWIQDPGYLANPAYGAYVIPPGPEYSVLVPVDVPAHGYLVVKQQIAVGVSGVGSYAPWVDEVKVRVNKVRYLAIPDVDSSIRDWAAQADFDVASPAPADYHFRFANTTAGVPDIPMGAGSSGDADPDPSIDQDFIDHGDTTPTDLTKGIAKNDPRVRRFVGWNPPGVVNQLPWAPVNALSGTNTTINLENTLVVDYHGGTGIGGLDCDQYPAAPASVAGHPSFVIKYVNNSVTNYESVGELGYIHTGLQWRTLLLQPCPVIEIISNSIPDWVVMDIFSVTNPPCQGRVNINATIASIPTTPARLAPLAAVMPTNSPVPVYGALPGAMASAVASMTWAGTSAWGLQRTTSTNTFTRTFLPAAYNMIGELCEVDKIANYAGVTDDGEKEAVIRAIANLVTTRSDTFTIWTLGQTISDQNANGLFDNNDTVTAEVKMQTVVQRYEEPPGTVKFRVLYSRYISQ